MKEVIHEVKKYFERTVQDADTFQKRVAPLDGELAKKIRHAKETNEEIVKHIQERNK